MTSVIYIEDWIDSVGGRQGQYEKSVQGQGVSDGEPVGRTGDLAVWRRPERTVKG